MQYHSCQRQHLGREGKAGVDVVRQPVNPPGLKPLFRAAKVVLVHIEVGRGQQRPQDLHGNKRRHRQQPPAHSPPGRPTVVEPRTLSHTGPTPLAPRRCLVGVRQRVVDQPRLTRTSHVRSIGHRKPLPNATAFGDIPIRVARDFPKAKISTGPAGGQTGHSAQDGHGPKDGRLQHTQPPGHQRGQRDQHDATGRRQPVPLRSREPSLRDAPQCQQAPAPAPCREPHQPGDQQQVTPVGEIPEGDRAGLLGGGKEGGLQAFGGQ